MKSCIVGSNFFMKMDIYERITTQDENTGALKKTWGFRSTQSCLARGQVSNSATSPGSNDKVGERYFNNEFIKIESPIRLSKTQRITNIRNQENEYIWIEQDSYTQDPTVFDVLGCIPVMDPFGSIISYNVTAKRSEVQSLES